MPTQRLRELLDQRGVVYQTIAHSSTYTAQGLAAMLHVPGHKLAKTTVVKLDGAFALAVLPAPLRVDLEALRDAADARSAALASESEFSRLFPGCELGAMPPFGNLYGLPVWVDYSLTLDSEIVFSAGTHREAVRMAYSDFERVVRPRAAAFAFG